MTDPQYHLNTRSMAEWLNDGVLPLNLTLPSYQEYDQRLIKFNSAINNYKNEINFHSKLQQDPNLTSKTRSDQIDNLEGLDLTVIRRHLTIQP